jgi:hypothetical protein
MQFEPNDTINNFFNSFTDDDLINMVLYNPTYLHNLCLALTLDMQLLQENKQLNLVC